LKYHYVREKVLKRDITFSFISIVDQIADMFTTAILQGCDYICNPTGKSDNLVGQAFMLVNEQKPSFAFLEGQSCAWLEACL
jgi:hypothetical protein